MRTGLVLVIAREAVLSAALLFLQYSNVMCSKREATVTAWGVQGGELHLFLSPLFLILLAFIVPRTPSLHFCVVF